MEAATLRSARISVADAQPADDEEDVAEGMAM